MKPALDDLDGRFQRALVRCEEHSDTRSRIGLRALPLGARAFMCFCAIFCSPSGRNWRRGQ